MRPTKTTYHLVTDKPTYKLCHALYRAADPEGAPIRLGFPTVYARRDDAIIGFLGTIPNCGMVAAGPLVVDPTLKAPAITAMRLCEAYEQILREAGVTSYRLAVDRARPEWAQALTRAGFTPYDETPELLCYERKVA
jgi:hypothetical protein